MPNDRLGTSYTDADALRDVFGGSSSGGSTGVYSDIDALRDVFGPQYVAGGPGGIPGAKDGALQRPTIGGSIAMPGMENMAGFQAVPGTLIPEDPAKRAEFEAMRRAGAEPQSWPTQVGAIIANQGNRTMQNLKDMAAGRASLHDMAMGLAPQSETGNPADSIVEDWANRASTSAQIMGGIPAMVPGLLDPARAAENAAMLATGGAVNPVATRMGEAVAARLAPKAAEILTARFGPEVASAIIQRVGPNAGNAIAGVLTDTAAGAAQTATAAGPQTAPYGLNAENLPAFLAEGGKGAAMGGAFSLPFHVLPAAVRSASGVREVNLARTVAEGQTAMRDVADVYRGAPRANEIDPAVLAARNAADAQALAQAAESAKIIENAPEPARVETPETQMGANREEAQGQAQGNQEGLLSKEPPSPDTPAAVDWSTKSYAEIRARAKELGVLDGPKTRAALVERVSAAETRSAQGTPTPESPESASARMGNGAAPAKETPSVATSQPSRPATADVGSGSSVQRSASPNPTRQPWEMTRAEFADEMRRIGTERGIPPTQATIKWGIGKHKATIERALSEGRAVPPEVLADYPDLAANAKPPTPAEAGTTPTGTAAGQAEAPKASGENTKFYPLGENPNETTNRYAIKRDERRQRAPSGWVLVDRNGSDKLVGVFDLPESVLEIAADTPDQMTSTGYTMKENKILALLKKKPEELSIILNRVRQARRSTSKTPLWSDGDGEIRQGEAVYRNMGRSSWDALNEAARSAKARIDRQRSATLGRVDTPKSVRGKDIYVYARSNAGQMKPVAGPFYTQHEAESAAMAARSRIDKDFSRESVIRELSGFSYGAVDRGTKVDVLYPDLRSPEGSSPFTDYPGTAQDTAPPEGSQETIAKAAPESHHQTQPAPQNETPTTRQSPPETDAKADRTTTQEVSPRESAPSDRATDPGYSRAYPSSPDFTARRVIDKPEPGEPQGPVTAAMNSMTSEMREALNLKAYDSPERRTFQATMDNAVAKKIPERALDIASSVVAKPRGLSAEEEAGMTYRLMELDNQRRTLKDRMSKAKDDAEAMTIDAEHDRAVAEIDTITTALNKGGSDIARALNIRKMLLADDFSIVGIRNRLKKYELRGGKKATPEQMREFEALADRFEELTKRVEKAAQDSIDASAESTLKRHAASKRGVDPKVREQNIATLAEKARTLLSQGCR